MKKKDLKKENKVLKEFISSLYRLYKWEEIYTDYLSGHITEGEHTRQAEIFATSFTDLTEEEILYRIKLLNSIISKLDVFDIANILNVVPLSVSMLFKRL